jgi:hypothetical protein
VAGVRDTPDQPRSSLGYVTENEAGGFDVPLGHQLEHAIHRSIDAKLLALPRVPRDDPPEILDLIPILDVDRHRGEARRAFGRSARHGAGRRE